MPTARDNHDAHDCAERIRERFVALLSRTCDGKPGPLCRLGIVGQAVVDDFPACTENCELVSHEKIRMVVP
jgi:hypothetical protein